MIKEICIQKQVLTFMSFTQKLLPRLKKEIIRFVALFHTSISVNAVNGWIPCLPLFQLAWTLNSSFGRFSLEDTKNRNILYIGYF